MKPRGPWNFVSFGRYSYMTCSMMLRVCVGYVPFNPRCSRFHRLLTITPLYVEAVTAPMILPAVWALNLLLPLTAGERLVRPFVALIELTLLFLRPG
jgi:hypothetical protein